MGCLLLAGVGGANASRSRRSKTKARASSGNVPATAPTAFAPVATDHPLASLWNDPDFNRRLLGSYGFRSAAEPPMSNEEKLLWHDSIVPLLREDPPKAIPALREAARPDSSAVFDFTLGTVYFQSGDFTNAVRHYETALAKFPDYERAWKNLGLVRVRMGDYAHAIQPLGRALELGGADAATLGLLGFAHLNNSQPVAAAAALQQALMFKPDDFNLQLQLLQAWIAGAQYDPALRLLKELLAAHPDRVNLWRLKAHVHLERNELKEAAITYETLRRIGQAKPVDLFTLGDLHVTLGAPELALTAYRQALRVGGGLAPDRALRAAEVLIAQGHTDEAKALLEAIRHPAQGSLSRPTELKWLRLKARLALARGDTDSALQTLEQILERNPLDGEALLLTGDCYARKDEREKAEFRYQAAAKIEAVAPDALVKQAQLLVRHQQYRRAAELLQKAQQLRPRPSVQQYLEQVIKLAGASKAS